MSGRNSSKGGLGADTATVDALVAKIKDGDETVRTEAWLGAGDVGAPAVKPLAKVIIEGELEVSRAAMRAIWQIVRHAGRPGATGETKAVVAELDGLLGGDQPKGLRREVLWMVSEIGGDESVDPVAALLSDEDLREDARMVLDRIPGTKSLDALKAALLAVPDDFKINIAQSLRHRGVEVSGHACRKLVPTRKTGLKPVK